MDEKSLQTLELPLVLAQLAKHCDFSVSHELALQLQPTTDLREAQGRQQETTSARLFLKTHPQSSIGSARDVRAISERAARNATLLPNELVEIRNTLSAARVLKTVILTTNEDYTLLRAHATKIPNLPQLEKELGRALDEVGKVVNAASPLLAEIRQNLTGAHDRLMQALERIIQNPRNTEFLQEKLITQRADRYVIPLKANFKGRIRGIVHDQSTSGATLFIEPLATLDLNNQWRELQIAERDEVKKVLHTLSEGVGAKSNQIILIVETLAVLDLAFARARYAEALHATEPELIDAPITTKASGRSCPIRMQDARHPLLQPECVVPINFNLDPGTNIVVITGPNTGGKTVALKTIGLLALMSACGLQLPVKAGATLPIFSGIFADIGDEQSIEQNLSTFSSHIGNITRILATVNAHSLVLLDEIGAGTDPDEGSALAQSLLQDLLQRGATTLVSTHYQRLKVFSHNTPSAINASVEFDPDTLAPVYHLTIGLPGRSNALAIAQRLGIPDKIIEGAQRLITDKDRKADKMLADIHRQRNKARNKLEQSEAILLQAKEQEAELTRRLASIDQERREILLHTHRKAQDEISTIRDEIKILRRQLRASGLPLQALQQIEHQASTLEQQTQLTDTHKPEDKLRLGDQVRIERLQTDGIITALSVRDAEVQIGRLRIRAGLDELHPSSVEIHTDSSQQNSSETVQWNTTSPGMELHLRGQNIEDGMEILDRYLNAALLANLPWVCIVHGKGTGKMRQAVRDVLRNHPEVKSFRPGGHTEGGDGVTVAMFTE